MVDLNFSSAREFPSCRMTSTTHMTLSPVTDGDTMETSASMTFSSRSLLSLRCTADELRLTASLNSAAVSLLFCCKTRNSITSNSSRGLRFLLFLSLMQVRSRHQMDCITLPCRCLARGFVSLYRRCSQKYSPPSLVVDDFLQR